MCSVLQCVAVCYRVLQRMAKCCICVAVCCSGVAVCCSELPCAAVRSSALHRAHKHHDTYTGTLQHRPALGSPRCVCVCEREREGGRESEQERGRER